MSSLINDRLLKTIRREPVDRTPIWIMRQAGRYLPEYRATRARAGSFMQLCKTPELACEVTLQPLLRYDLDAAIIFSDILTIPDAMGLGLRFTEGEGPSFDYPVRTEKAIASLEVPPPEKLNYVYDAIALVTQELAGKVPLIGFCGTPWTLAAYMVEGRSKQGFDQALGMVSRSPHLMHNLLNTLANSVASHLNAQIEAGASVVMLFDSWGGILGPNDFADFSLNYSKAVIAMLRNHYNKVDTPIILFTKGGSNYLNVIANAGCDVVGLDWEVTLHQAREQIGDKVALQGNMHPSCLLGTPEDIRKEVAQILASFGSGSGHIFNLGHGITPNVPPDNMKVLVDAVHELSGVYHKG